MACRLQKLFSMEADFEDEDFLLAVKDVEKQASDPPTVNLKGLRSLSTGLRAPSSTVAMAKDSEVIFPSTPASPVLFMEDQSKFGKNSCLSQLKSNQMSPLVSSLKIQKDPATLPPEHKVMSTSGTKYKFVKRQPTELPTGSAPHDEIDNGQVLAACMDPEESCVWSCPRSSSIATPKKPRVTDPVLLVKSVGWENTSLKKTQDGTSMEVVSHLQPVETSSKLTLRPFTRTSCLSPSILGVTGSTDPYSNSGCQMVKSFQSPLDKSTADGHSLSFGLARPSPSFQSGSTNPRLSKPCVPTSNYSGSTKVSSNGQLLTAYGTSASPVSNPLATTKAPLSTAATGSLQSPVVTNHLVRLVTAANKTPQPTSQVSLRTKVRRFPGPAGLLPQQPDARNLEEILIATPQTPTHGALAKLQIEELPPSQQPTELEFERGPWLAMKTEMGLDDSDPSCFLRTYSVIMVLRKAALKQLPKNKVPSMAVMIKSLTRTNVDAGAVFKDSTGEMQGTIHRLLLEENENGFKPGSVLLLKQVGVFSPSHRNHYLNVTPSNLVKIYPPGLNSGMCLQSFQEIRGRMEVVTPQVVSESPSNIPSDAGTKMAIMDRHSRESHRKDRNCSHNESDGVSSLTSIELIPRAGKTVLNVPTPEAEKVDSDDLDQLLRDLPDDIFSPLDTENSL